MPVLVRPLPVRAAPGTDAGTRRRRHHPIATPDDVKSPTGTGLHTRAAMACTCPGRPVPDGVVVTPVDLGVAEHTRLVSATRRCSPISGRLHRLAGTAKVSGATRR